MTRVLLAGYNPPQFVHNRKIEAAHYRTWQFLQPLLYGGHTVCLCADPAGEHGAPVETPLEWGDRLRQSPVRFGEIGWRNELQRAHDHFEPDCVVAVNFSHCLYATKLCTDRPLWMDIYGDMLTIMQASFYRSQSDRGLDTSLAFMHQVLQRGDVFSGCGLPQQHALVGELAMTGRLNRRTFGYEFVHVVRPGAPQSPGRPAATPAHRNLLRSCGVADDEFVVLWCGGYNAWTDVDTLFRGLEAAMAQQPKLAYVSVGENSYQGADNVYARLLSLIEQSPYRSRFHMLGWRPWHEVATYYQESDIGINIDAYHYETVYGTRTRLVEMIGAGLPVITSLGAELSYMLRDAGAALAFEIGDWRALAQQLAQIAGDRGGRQAMAGAAHAYAQTELSFANTTKQLQAWVNSPSHAPDKLRQNAPHPTRRLEHKARAIARQVLWRLFDRDQ